MSNDIQNPQEDLLTDVVQQLNAVKRKKLLPWWMKVFMWIFLIAGGYSLILIFMGIFGYNIQLSFYGMQSTESWSVKGTTLLVLMILKGVTSYGLIQETDWAIKVGIVDAVLGCAVCILVMMFPDDFVEYGAHPGFRLELIFLIPYLYKLLKIQSAWESKVNI